MVPRHTFNFPGLEGKWLRFAVRSMEENRKLLEVMKAMAHHSSLIFITGGVRSGKSRFAEEMTISLSKATEFSGTGPLHYIAAMQRSDGEMKQRIIRHQKTVVNKADITGRHGNSLLRLEERLPIF